MATARDLKPNVRNTNKGTERGAVQLEKSVERYGYGRSVLVDKNDQFVAGQHIGGIAAEKGAKIKVVETRGDELVVVKRVDLDLNDPKDKRAVELSIADNRTRDVNGAWDEDAIQFEIANGADLSAFWREDELAKKLKEQDEAEKKALKKADGNTVKLEYDDDQYAEFARLKSAAGKKLGIKATADIVLAALDVFVKAK